MGVLADLVDLVLPRACPGCGAAASLLCGPCAAALRASPARPASPTPRPEGLPRVVAGTAYGGLVTGVLVAHKERGRLGLVRPLGAVLAGAVRGLEAGPCVLVPVPSARAAVRARGHDHALRLARAAGAALGLPAAPLLVPARRVDDQAGLDARARAANLAGALRARGVVPGLPVVVVDDVMTTGATLVEAARALAAGGADVRGAAVVAATVKRASPDRARPLPFSGSSG